MAGPGVARASPRPVTSPFGNNLGHRLDIASSQAAAAVERARELTLQVECALAENRVLRQAIGASIRGGQSVPARPEPLQRWSEPARMAARLQTMPVIEQAKGILMAQLRCGEAEAFDLLRRASQRGNVPVRDLAAGLVAKAAGQVHVSAPGKPGPVRRTARGSAAEAGYQSLAATPVPGIGCRNELDRT